MGATSGQTAQTTLTDATTDENGQVNTVQYEFMTSILAKAIQDVNKGYTLNNLGSGATSTISSFYRGTDKAALTVDASGNIGVGTLTPSDKLTVSGNLTLHGVTKPVVLEVEGPNGPVPGMDKKQHLGFSVTTKLNRKDFGIGTKYPPAVVGDDVSLTIDLDAVKQQ